METSTKHIAIYPGTFDPITNAHMSLVFRALELFDSIIIAVAHDTNKTPLFTIEERVDMIQTVFASEQNIIVDSFRGLLVEYAMEKKITKIIRGLRAVSDFEYEFQTSLMNRSLCHEVETVFFISDYQWLYTSSTIVKTVANLGGNIQDFVPNYVAQCLQQKFSSLKA